MADNLKFNIDVATGQSAKNLKDAAKAATDLGVSLDAVKPKGQQVAAALSAVADQMQSEMTKTSTAASALGQALGPDLTARLASGGGVDALVAKFRGLGLEFSEIEESANELAAAVKKIDQSSRGGGSLVPGADQAAADLQHVTTEAKQAAAAIQQVGKAGAFPPPLAGTEGRLRSVTGGMKQLGHETDQTRSVMANFTGNAISTLPGIGTALGPINQAIGQFGEYAAEGNIKLAQFAAAAGPMAAVSGALIVVDQVMSKIKERDAFHAEDIEQFAKAILDGKYAVEALEERLKAAGKVQFTPVGSALDPFGDAVKDVTKEVTAAGLSVEQYSQLVIQGGPAINAWVESQKAAGTFTNNTVTAVMALIEANADYTAGVKAAATSREFFGLGVAQTGDVYTIAANAQTAAAEAAKQAAAKIANASQQVAGTGDVYSIAARAQQGYADHVDTTANEAARLTRETALQAKATVDAATDATAAAVRWNGYEKSLAGIASATDTVAREAGYLSASLTQVADAATGSERANLDLDDSYAKLRDARKANGKTVAEDTQKGRDNQRAILDTADAIRNNLIQQLKDSGGSYDQVTRSADMYRGQLKDQLKQFGITGAAADDYIRKLGLAPEQIETSIVLSGQAKAKDDLQTLNVQLDDIPDEKKSEFIADINKGDYAAAVALFTDLAKPGGHNRDVPFDSTIDTTVVDGRLHELEQEQHPVPVHLDPETADIDGALHELQQEPHDAPVTVSADTAEALQRIHALNGTNIKVNLIPIKGAFSKGTHSAKPGLAEVAEDAPEIIQGKDGAVLVKKRSLVVLKGGERIYNGRETAAMLAGGAGTGPGTAIPGYAGGAFGGTYSSSQVMVTTTPAAAVAGGPSGDEVTAEQDRIQAAMYETGRISLDAYRQYVQGRLAESKDLSADYITQFRLLGQLADTEKQTAADRARAAQDAADAEKQAADDSIAAQDSVMKNMFALGAISAQQYEEYLRGRLGSFQAYTDGYTAIALQIKSMEDQQVADRVKVVQDQADQELAIYKQLQADKAVVDAEAEQARQTAQTFATGEKGGKIMADRHSSAEDQAQAVQDLEDDQSKLAELTWNTIQAKAAAANLSTGSVDWDRLVRALLIEAINNFGGAGLSVSAALLGGQLSGVPALAAGGFVPFRPGGTLAKIAEQSGTRGEHVVRDDTMQALLQGIQALQIQPRGHNITINQPAGVRASDTVTALKRYDRLNGTTNGRRPYHVAV